MLNAYKARELQEQTRIETNRQKCKKFLELVDEEIKRAIEADREEVFFNSELVGLETLQQAQKELSKRGYVTNIRFFINDGWAKEYRLKVNWKRRTFKNFLRDWLLRKKDKKRELDRIMEMTRG